jgi:hypothetical protein
MMELQSGRRLPATLLGAMLHEIAPLPGPSPEAPTDLPGSAKIPLHDHGVDDIA